jgi:hypothetical protein
MPAAILRNQADKQQLGFPSLYKGRNEKDKNTGSYSSYRFIDELF